MVLFLKKKLFSRNIKDKKSKANEKKVLAKIDQDYEIELAKLKGVLVDKLFVLVKWKNGSRS